MFLQNIECIYWYKNIGRVVVLYDAENSPTSTSRRSPGFDQMYVGESVTFSCEVDVPSSWEYLWFKDGTQLTSNSSKFDYTISSPALSDGGLYKCKGKRGRHNFFANDSETVSLKIIGKKRRYL